MGNRAQKKKILICFGTRPEALKLLSLILGLQRHPRLKPVVCLTGQHRQMVDQVVRLFKIPVDIDLDLMLPNQTLAGLSQRVLGKMDEVIERVKPDCLVVQGDTTTAFLAALSGFYRKVKVAHVEAGLRSDDKYQPFPEEINRRLITQTGDFHFAPTRLAARRLLREGVAKRDILETGNTGIDALLKMCSLLKGKKPPEAVPTLRPGRRLVLVTAHRRESFGKPLLDVFGAIRRIAERFEDVEVVYPVHLNPNVRQAVRKTLAGHPRIHLIEPVPYDALVWLMSRAELILTDSGGIQEEAPSFAKPILVLRNVTERPEGVRAGFARLVGTDPGKIYREAARILSEPKLAARLQGKANPYGDGKAGERIIRFLDKRLGR